VTVVPHGVREIADAPRFDPAGPALVAGRIAVEKGFDVAVDACRAAGRALVVAGDGPLRAELEARAAGADVRFVGRVDARELARLRAASSVALIPSRSAETFGLAAAEAMAAGLPVIASRVGALTELVGDAGTLVQPGDRAALANALRAMAGDGAVPRSDAAARTGEGAVASSDAAARAGETARAGLARVRELAAPDRVAAALGAVYAQAVAARPERAVSPRPV
jgi:glycosyltransferase involved in cell wall biosynthesis